ncbi:hypothetical protein RV072_002214 [Vibrio vulnificus]|nr:hypothetical protein [Vibrio vulnificus]
MSRAAWWLMGVAVAVWAMRGNVTTSIDKWTADNTQTAGKVLSDFLAKFNGWEPVELAPLMIRDFYLDDEKRLTPEADFTLWKVAQYQPYLKELFGKRGGQLKPQYHALVNVAITNQLMDR